MQCQCDALQCQCNPMQCDCDALQFDCDLMQCECNPLQCECDASKIAGMEIMNFQKLLADRGICVHYDVEDFEHWGGKKPVG